MQATFPGYYRPSDADLDALCFQASIVLDASAMLRVHEYTKATQELALTTLQLHADRLWVPYLVAREYQERRDKVVRAQSDVAKHTQRVIDQKLDDVVRSVKEFVAERKWLDQQKAAEALVARVEQRVRGIRASIDIPAQATADADAVRARFDGMLLDKVGDPVNKVDLDTLHAKAKTRYQEKTPPVRSWSEHDLKEKSAPELWRDFLLWHELLEHARSTKRALILVSNDQREEWWDRAVDGVARDGPNKALVNEMSQDTRRRFEIMTLEDFLLRSARAFRRRHEVAADDIKGPGSPSPKPDASDS